MSPVNENEIVENDVAVRSWIRPSRASQESLKLFEFGYAFGIKAIQSPGPHQLCGII